MKTTFLIVFKN